jgi:hypothetical protein
MNHPLFSDNEKVMRIFDKSLELFGQQNKQPAAHGMDKESLFCLSLASRLRRQSPQKKAMVRNSIENIFFQIEYGNSLTDISAFGMASGFAPLNKQTFD